MTTQENPARRLQSHSAREEKLHDDTRRLRILHVVFSPRIAGSERYCIDLANEQAALGHEVHVAGNHGSPIAGLLAEGIVFHGFRTPFLRGLKLRRLVSHNGIEICHAHLSPACKAAATLPKSVTRIATLHVGFKARQHSRLDGVICVNSAQLTRLGDYSGRSRLISNWLPDVKDGDGFDLRSELELPRETRLIGAVGRLHPSKGYDVLVSAFLRSAPGDAALVIIGEGPHRAALEKLAAGDRRIHLIGHRDNVSGFLRNLDHFVSPSREESFGLAILEAMQEGLPIIATATEGPSEYLRSHPVTLVAPGSIDQLSSALATALEGDRNDRTRRMKYDLSSFSRSTGVANVMDFYSQVASKSDDYLAHSARISLKHVSQAQE